MSTKLTKIIYWITTGIIFIMFGVTSMFMGFSESTAIAFAQFGYPDYFCYALSVFKILGTIALILPFTPKLLKEWAYAGFIFDCVFASISTVAINGLSVMAIVFPLLFVVVIMVSYFCNKKLHQTY